MAILNILICLATVAAVGIVGANGPDVLNTGITLSLNGILYYLPGNPFSLGHTDAYTTCTSGSRSSGLGLVPITLVNSDSATFNLGALGTIIDGFGKQDDVWGEAFLSGETRSLSTLPPASSSTFELCPRSMPPRKSKFDIKTS